MISSLSRALLCTVALAPAPQEQAAAPPHDLFELLESLRERFDVPALAGIVIDLDGTLAEGYAGLRERGSEAPVGADDRFHLGSCTKSMTATVAATLIEEGELDWDSSLATIFPELAEAMQADWREVTLDQLLSHTAGAPENLAGYGALGLKLSGSKEPLPAVRQALVEGVTGRPPVFEPGTAYRYSNMGYTMAGAMLERVSGESWEQLLRQRLFEPLGMTSAGFGPPCSKEELDHPRGHDDKGRVRPGADNPAFIGPAGTVHATLGDWAKYVRLHLRGARGETGLLLEPETFERLHATRPGTGETYAAGWLTLERPWSKGGLLAHNGSNTLWFAWVWIAPEEGFAVLSACNQGGDAGAKAADAAVAAMIRELPGWRAEEER